MPPSSLFFFLVQLQQNIDISVSFALFFSSGANYISCAVTIVSASCGLSPSFMIMLILKCYIVSLDSLVENA